MSCFYPVALCIVVFCCFPLLAVGDILFASAYFWAIFSEWGFVPPLVFEALSSCCIKALSLFSILSLRPHIILRLCPHICEASSSYFILRLHSHILFGVFVLIFDLRFHPHGYILRWCSSVWDFGPHCCRPLLVCLQWFVCGSVCLYFCLG